MYQLLTAVKLFRSNWGGGGGFWQHGNLYGYAPDRCNTYLSFISFTLFSPKLKGEHILDETKLKKRSLQDFVGRIWLMTFVTL